MVRDHVDVSISGEPDRVVDLLKETLRRMRVDGWKDLMFKVPVPDDPDDAWSANYIEVCGDRPENEKELASRARREKQLRDEKRLNALKVLSRGLHASLINSANVTVVLKCPSCGHVAKLSYERHQKFEAAWMHRCHRCSRVEAVMPDLHRLRDGCELSMVDEYLWECEKSDAKQR